MVRREGRGGGEVSPPPGVRLESGGPAFVLLSSPIDTSQPDQPLTDPEYTTANVASGFFIKVVVVVGRG